MSDDLERSPELQQARAVLRAIEPPEGLQQRVEGRLLAQAQRARGVRTGWRWGAGLALLAASSAAAVSDWNPVRQLFATQAQATAHGTSEKVAPAPRTAPITSKPAVDLLADEEPTQEEPVQEEPVQPELAAHAPRAVANKQHDNAPEQPSTTTTQRTPEPSELSRMVAQYQQAKQLAQRDPAAGLAAFRALQQRWPSGPLRTEVDLQVVALLNRMGRHDESKREAEDFLRAHPDSARAGELKGTLK